MKGLLVHLADTMLPQAVKEFSKVRLRKRAQSHILRQGPKGLPRNILPRADHGGRLPNQRLGGARAGEAEDALFLIREEVAIMKKLNHPNLVQLIEVLDDPEEDSLYMVMEMCKKGVVMKVGLDELADPYSPEACRCWFRDLILGIEYCEIPRPFISVACVTNKKQYMRKVSFTETSSRTTSSCRTMTFSKSWTLAFLRCSRKQKTCG